MEHKNYICTSCSCEHDHSHDENIWLFGARLFFAACVVISHLLDVLPHEWEDYFFILAYLSASYKILWQAIKNLLQRRFFDENLLMLIASAGAFALGDTEEAISVMIFYGVGELMQSIAVQRSRKNITALMDIRPDVAHWVNNNNIQSVHPDTIPVNSTIIVQPNEKIPLDGIVLSGDSQADTRALTGESTPLHITQNTEVLSGFINITAPLQIRTTKTFDECSASQILKLANAAQDRKSTSEQFITTFARYYTPFIVLVAAIVAFIPPLLGKGDFETWIYRALTFLIISCPCALVISIPISFFGGIGAAARRGVLVKGGNYLDALNRIKTMVFHTTGVLTEGILKVTQICPIATQISAEELLNYAAIAQINSNDPVAQAIRSAGGTPSTPNITTQPYNEQGVLANTPQQEIAVGNIQLMEQLGIQHLPQFDCRAVYIALNKEYIGYILLEDPTKTGVVEAIGQLKKLGIRCIGLSGSENSKDHYSTQQLLDSSILEQSAPAQLNALEALLDQKSKRSNLAFVGEGIKDVPLITRADVGVTLGGLGSDVAINAANIVVMNDDIGKLPLAIRVANKTRNIVLQNIVFAIAVKIAVMVLAVFGYTSMWFAIFADVGVALLAVLNALRTMRI